MLTERIVTTKIKKKRPKMVHFYEASVILMLNIVIKAARSVYLVKCRFY